MFTQNNPHVRDEARLCTLHLKWSFNNNTTNKQTNKQDIPKHLTLFVPGYLKHLIPGAGKNNPLIIS